MPLVLNGIGSRLGEASPSLKDVGGNYSGDPVLDIDFTDESVLLADYYPDAFINSHAYPYPVLGADGQFRYIEHNLALWSEDLTRVANYGVNSNTPYVRGGSDAGTVFVTRNLGNVGPNGEPVIECDMRYNLNSNTQSNTYRQFWYSALAGLLVNTNLRGKAFRATWMVKGEPGATLGAWLDIAGGTILAAQLVTLTGAWQEIKLEGRFSSAESSVVSSLSTRVGTRAIGGVPVGTANVIQICRTSLCEVYDLAHETTYVKTRNYLGFKHTPNRWLNGVWRNLGIDLRNNQNYITYSDFLVGGNCGVLVRASAVTGTESPGSNRMLGMKLVEDSSLDTHYIGSNGVTVGNGNWSTCVSVYVKAGERNKFILGVFKSVDFRVHFDLATQTSSVVSGSPLAYGLEAVPGNPGWYRAWVTTAANNVTTAYPIIMLSNSASGTYFYQGDGVSGVYLFGLQLQQYGVIYGGAGHENRQPGKYLPTGSTGSITYDPSLYVNLGPYVTANQGTIVLDGVVGAAGDGPAFTIYDGSSNNMLTADITGVSYVTPSNSYTSRGQFNRNGSTVISNAHKTPPDAIPATFNAKVGLSWDTAGLLSTFNGRIPSTGAGNCKLSFPAFLRFYVNGYGGGRTDGYIRRITVWDRKLSAAELQAATAP